MVKLQVQQQLAAETAIFARAFEIVSANPILAMAVSAAVVAAVVKASSAFETAKGSAKTTLQKDKFVPLVLKKKIIVSHDTRIFQFALPSDQHVLGLPTGKHVLVSANINGSVTQRSYTPISSNDDKGVVELMIKVYKAGVHPNFPDGGKMSQYLDTLREGIDTLNFRGPTGRFEYKGRGHCFNKRDRHVKRLAMIGGGTGITPLLQVIRAVLKDPHDTTEMALIFANRTEEDILLREELEQCAKDPRFKLWYTLGRPPQQWEYSEGYISEEMIKERLFPASDDTLVLLCGPPPMITHACKPNLEKHGFTAEHFVVF